MATNARFIDDASVNNLLDDLIADAQEQSEATRSAPISLHPQAVVSASTIPDALQTANTILSSFDNSPQLPLLAMDKSNTDKVLAATLTILVRVLRSNSANVSLRQKSEASAHHANNEIDTLRERLVAERRKSESRANDAAAAKKHVESLIATRKLEARRHNLEVSELRANLTATRTRQRKSEQDVRLRDKELAVLKNRVHALIQSSRNNSPMLPRFTLAPGQKPSHRQQSGARVSADIDEGVAKAAAKAKEAQVTELKRENFIFRDLLRSLHQDLDAISISSTRHRGVLTSKTTYDRPSENTDETENNIPGADDGTDNSQEAGEDVNEGGETAVEEQVDLQEGAPWDSVLQNDDKTDPNPDPAEEAPEGPTEEQIMNFPCDTFQKEMVDSFDHKLMLMRMALASI